MLGVCTPSSFISLEIVLLKLGTHIQGRTTILLSRKEFWNCHPLTLIMVVVACMVRAKINTGARLRLSRGKYLGFRTSLAYAGQLFLVTLEKFHLK